MYVGLDPQAVANAPCDQQKAARLCFARFASSAQARTLAYNLGSDRAGLDSRRYNVDRYAPTR